MRRAAGRRGRLAIGLGLLLASVAVAGRAGAGSGPAVEIRSPDTGKKLSDVPLHVGSDFTAASAPVLVANTGDGDATDLKLNAILSGVSASVDVSDVGSDGKFTLKPGEQRLATVGVTAVASLTQGVQGAIWATVGGSATKIATVTVSKDASAALVVDGASANALTVDSSAAAFSHIFRVINTTSATVNDLVVQTSSFQANAAQPANATLLVGGQSYQPPATLQVPGNGFVPLEIRIDLPTVATYTGSISLIYAGATHTVSVSINRKSDPATITLGSVAPPHVHPGETADLNIDVRESGGRTVTLDPPTLADVVRKNGTDQFSAASVSLTGPDASLLQLGPNQPRHYVVKVRGLNKPGEYTGKLRFRGGDAAPVDATFSVFVKEPQWIAVVLIAVGVAVSAGLTYWLTKRQGRLRARLQAGELSDQLNAMVGKDETIAGSDPVKALRSRLDGVRTSPDPATAHAALDEVQTKLAILRRWIAVKQRLAEAPNVDIPPTLAAVDAFLTSTGNGDAAKDALANVVKAQQSLDAQLTVRPEIAALRTRVTDWGLGAAARTQAMTEVLARLDNAEDAADAGDAAGAAVQLRRAQQTWVLHLGDELTSSVSGSAPPGVAAATWTQVRTDARAAADQALAPAASPDLAVAAYTRGVTAVCSASVDGLLKLANDTLAIPDAPNRPQVEAVRDLLTGARRALEAGDLDLARGSYDKARAIYQSIGVQAEAGEVPPPPPAGPLAAPRVTTGTEMVVVHAPTWTRVQLVGGNFLVFVVFLIIAVLLGLSLLYYNSATWGGGQDYAAAALWGLGLHSAGDSFTNLSGLMSKFRPA